MTLVAFQLYRAVAVAILGAVLALGLDAYRALVRSARPGRLELVLWDLLAVALLGVVGFAWLFAAAYWSLRLYVPLGLAVGAGAYALLAHPVLGPAADRALGRAVRLARAIRGAAARALARLARRSPP